ncbi:MAG TPA: peptide chain release factor N(5)-glutamine methyltransferase [Myxococcales bacterium]|jgi:release factor glutamine methyltransferase|nr:peptide chain release factor N(5)-glutamine methyltransferase [Myxococcales bacterium]
METWTVKSLLAWAREWLAKKGVENPRLDAELLLAKALNVDRVRLYIDTDKPLGADELARFKPMVQRRGAREPVAYILGVREFYGRPFAVGPGVFIPRPETELLVQLALEAIPPDARVLDLCAGSGAVGVSIAFTRPQAQVDLVELSRDAAVFTRQNVEKHAPGRANVFEGDLFAALPAGKRYHAVVSNPPYVPLRDKPTLARELLDHEPALALFSGDDGLSALKRIVPEAPAWLEPGGFFGVEIDPPQAAAVVALCEAAGLTGIRVQRDLAGLDRHVVARRT